MIQKIRPVQLTIVFTLLLFTSCNKKGKKQGTNIARSPAAVQSLLPALIRNWLNYVEAHQGKLEDSTLFLQPAVTKKIYEQVDFDPVWSKKGKWNPLGDSVLQFIEHAKLFGLFPEDYHGLELKRIRTLFHNDSAGKGDRKDAGLWSKADVLITDAFVQVIKDIKLGRLQRDSVTLRKDSVLTDEFYLQQFDALQKNKEWSQLVRSLEPVHPGYRQLKAAIPRFLDSIEDRVFTKVVSREKDPKNFKVTLQKRLYEGGFLATDSVAADSATLSAAIKKFQIKKGITADGRVGETTIRMLNATDKDRFIRIALSLDKYKMLPETMPPKYIWVNLPGYYLVVQEGDSTRLTSRIVCGKPLTNTPQLTSAISEMITYPKWTVPTSIILKEILPAQKRNPGYLAKKGFSLIDRKGNVVDPLSVDWSKYNKGIPYSVVQGSGDANALGVFKFNFSNNYSVYLHDTNQRYLFGLPSRALSHGCVRVQEWQPLARYILRNDNPSALSDASRARQDSMSNWLAHKQKHNIPLHNRLPLFIRYFTCEGKNGNIVFYDDIYGEDRLLAQRHFAGK